MVLSFISFAEVLMAPLNQFSLIKWINSSVLQSCHMPGTLNNNILFINHISSISSQLEMSK